MRFQTRKQTVAIHILPNIWRSKGKQEFGQLIKYNMKNNFCEKSCENMVRKLVPETFYKIKIDQISKSAV